MTEEVDEDTGLPPAVCSACAETTVSAVHFRQLCFESAQHWKQAVASLLKIEDPTDDDKTFYVFYDGVEETVVKDKIERICNETEAFDRLTATKTDPVASPKKKRPQNIKRCKCPDCGKAFLIPFYLNEHLKGSLKGACPECGVVMKRELLAQHLYDAHSKEVLVCGTCHMLFDDIKPLQLHFETLHNESSHICPICGCGFTNSRALTSHSYAHTLFHCSSCSLSFENRQCYKYHQRKCQVNKEKCDPPLSIFICDYCSAKYDKKPSLRIHIIQKHLHILPYVCETCGKRASTLPHLRSHENTHVTQRQVFECHCGAKMRTGLGFQLHQRIHSGEKPYKCDECGDCFLSSSRRLDHIKRRHRSTKEMPHGCEKCPARFVRPFELKKHYMTVHYSNVDVKAMKKRVRHELHEELACPQGTCVTCIKSVIAAQEFRTLVRNSQNLWHKAIKSLEDLPKSSSYSVKSICAFMTKEDLSLRTVTDYTGGDPKTILNRVTHKLMGNKKTVPDRKPRLTRTGPPCNCTDCGQQFLSPYYLNSHLKNSGQKEACLLCGTIVVRGREMKEHLMVVHGETVHLCPSCPGWFKTVGELKIHVITAHRAGALTCGDCGRTFPRSSAFEAHSQMHAVRTCRACGAQFTNRACYRRHRSECEPEAKPDMQNVPRSRRSNIRDPATFICDHCNKKYHSRPQLKNHILWIHMDVRPHQCQWCGKRFYTPARLAEHSVVHTRERNFECDICGFKLVSKMAAVYHRRRHTGEKPYECEDCDEKFISASRRSEHAKRRHGKGLRIQCMQCTLSFVRRHELMKHMEKRHRTQGQKISGEVC